MLTIKLQPLETEDEHDAPKEGAHDQNNRKAAIEFRQVHFAYDSEGPPVLKGISFKIQPGSMVALVGATGGGKTTISSLLMRFYEPQNGHILLGGVPISTQDRSALRRSIAYVPQDVFLFRGTVMSNLTVTGVSEDAARQAAQALGVERFITRLSGGYEHPIEDRGANLSAGERQILSFVRAFAGDPDILLLDEATASIDPATERIIQDATSKLLEGRTSLVIAHRLSTIRRAANILVRHRHVQRRYRQY